MGHAGAWAAPGENNALGKWKILENAGVTMVDHPAKFGSVMKDILSSSGRDVKGIVSFSGISSWDYRANAA
jgi:succinyl-CoA synthetase alpha subunit